MATKKEADKLKKKSVAAKTQSKKNSNAIKVEMLSSTLLSSGLLMLHLPIALLLVFWFLITMPADMAYPLLSVEQTSGWETVSWVIFGLFLLQVIFGAFFGKIYRNNKKSAHYGAYFFAFVQLISISLWMQTFVGLAGPALGLEGAINVALYFVWILGLLMNPLGLHFAWMIVKEMRTN